MGLFESILDDMAQWRRWEIWSRPDRPRRPHRDPLDGFLPYAKAAAVMGVSESEAVELGLRGMLEIDLERALIRPAVVSVLGVRTG